MTVREMVKATQVEILQGDLTPHRAAELDVKLTALLGSCFEEIRSADVAYAQVLLGCLNSEKKANRARIVAEITPEFGRKREARDTREVVQEMIRSLRQMQRTLDSEMRLTR